MASSGFRRGPGSHSTTLLQDPAVHVRDREHEQGAETPSIADEQAQRRIAVGDDAAEPVAGREPREDDADQRAPDVERVAERGREHAAGGDLEPEQGGAGEEDGDADRDRAALLAAASALDGSRTRTASTPARSSSSICAGVTPAMSAIASLPAGTSESRSSTCASGSSASRAASTKSSGSKCSSASSSSSSRATWTTSSTPACELDLLVAGADDARVAGGAVGGDESGARRPRESRLIRLGEQRLGAAGLGLESLGRAGHGEDERDPVALGDGLAQTSRAGHSPPL